MNEVSIIPYIQYISWDKLTPFKQDPSQYPQILKAHIRQDSKLELKGGGEEMLREWAEEPVQWE